MSEEIKDEFRQGEEEAGKQEGADLEAVKQGESGAPLVKFTLLAIMLNVVLFFILLLLVFFIKKEGVSFLSVLLLIVCPMVWLVIAVLIFKKMIDKVSNNHIEKK